MTVADIHIGISIFRQNKDFVSKCLQSALLQRGVSTIITVRLDGPDSIEKDLRHWLLEQQNEHDNLIIIDGSERLGTFGSYAEIFRRPVASAICQLDADDYLAPYALHHANCALTSNLGLAFVYTDCLEIDSRGTPIRLGIRQRTPYSFHGLMKNFMTFHMRLVRYEAYKLAGGYDGTFLYAGDYDLSLRLSEVGDVAFLERPLYLYRIHKTNTSSEKLHDLNCEALRAIEGALYRRGMNETHVMRVLPNGEVMISPEVHDAGLTQESTWRQGDIFYISPEEQPI